jgi:hypothetical protein
MADDEAAARRGPAPRHSGNDGALQPLPLRAEGLGWGAGWVGPAAQEPGTGRRIYSVA